MNATEFQAVDINAWMRPGLPGLELPTDLAATDFVLVDQEGTFFSLDGIHPNNLGQALEAIRRVPEMPLPRR